MKPKVPDWNKPAVEIPIEDFREFVATYGAAVSVLLAWSPGKDYQILTMGSDRAFADAAVRFREQLLEGLRKTGHAVDLNGPIKDLRGDHKTTSVILDSSQLDFILWVLGYMLGVSDVSPNKGEYIRKYHDQLLPLFGDAKETLATLPTDG